MPVNMSLYPDNWDEIRARILRRAGGIEDDPRLGAKCEWCGVHNYSVGYRDAQGNFIPNAGNGPCDASGIGQHWPGGYLTYSEAKEFAEHNNEEEQDGNHWIVIVLTIAHLKDPDPMNVSDDNLASLCQRCHNKFDIEMRRKNARLTRQGRQLEAGQLVMF